LWSQYCWGQHYIPKTSSCIIELVIKNSKKSAPQSSHSSKSTASPWFSTCLWAAVVVWTTLLHQSLQLFIIVSGHHALSLYPKWKIHIPIEIRRLPRAVKKILQDENSEPVEWIAPLRIFSDHSCMLVRLSYRFACNIPPTWSRKLSGELSKRRIDERSNPAAFQQSPLSLSDRKETNNVYSWWNKITAMHRKKSLLKYES